MENKYCWRCEKEVPFLNEDEFEQIRNLYSECIRLVKDHRKKTGTTLQETPLNAIFDPVRKAYEKMTGYEKSELVGKNG